MRRGPRAALVLSVMTVLVGGPVEGQQSLPPSVTEGHSNEAKQICQLGTYPLDAADNVIDRSHPKYFVEVSEISTRGTRRLIQASIPGTAPERIVCQRINAPVDIGSKIDIRINHSFLKKNQFRGKFAITAHVDGPAGSRPVEVPGYSVIGKTTETVSSNVADLAGLSAAMTEIWRRSPQVGFDLEGARKTAQSKQANVATQISARTDSIVAALAYMHADSIALRAPSEQLATIRRAIAAGTTAAGDTTELLATLGATSDKLAQREAKMREIAVRLAMDSAALRRATSKEFVNSAQLILTRQQFLLTAIAQVSDASNAPLVRMYARAGGNLPEMMVRLAVVTDSLWQGVLKQIPPR